MIEKIEYLETMNSNLLDRLDKVEKDLSYYKQLYLIEKERTETFRKEKERGQTVSFGKEKSVLKQRPRVVYTIDNPRDRLSGFLFEVLKKKIYSS